MFISFSQPGGQDCDKVDSVRQTLLAAARVLRAALDADSPETLWDVKRMGELRDKLGAEHHVEVSKRLGWGR